MTVLLRLNNKSSKAVSSRVEREEGLSTHSSPAFVVTRCICRQWRGYSPLRGMSRTLCPPSSRRSVPRVSSAWVHHNLPSGRQGSIFGRHVTKSLLLLPGERLPVRDQRRRVAAEGHVLPAEAAIPWGWQPESSPVAPAVKLAQD